MQKKNLIKANCFITNISVIFFLSFFSKHSLAENEKMAPVKITQVTAVVLRDMTPDTYVDMKDGQVHGFAIDLLNSVAKKINFKVNYLVVDDWYEAEDALRAGKADFCPTLTVNDKRKEEFLISNPVETFAISIAVRNQNNDISDTNSLKGKTVGVLRQGQAFHNLKKMKGFTLADFNLFQVAIFELLAGHIDAFVAPEPVIRNILVETGLEQSIKIISPPLSESKRAYAFSKDKQQLFDQITPVLHNIVQSKEYKEIYSKWFLPPTPYWTIKRALIGTSVLFVLVFLVFAFFYYRSIIKLNKQLLITVNEKEDALVKLENSIQQIQNINTELEEAKEKAEESDRLKTAFVQNMSHEIRTPMNAISGFAELIPQSLNDKQKLLRYSNIINQRSSDLLEIIDEILEISRIETGQVSVKQEACDLNQVLTDIRNFFNEYQARINKEHIDFRIKTQCNSEESIIITDKIKLKQILINLISNAFKFTENGTVEMGCKLSVDNKITFYVKDTGIGIPREKHDYIFERFSKLEASNDHLYGGTGLGLSIVKGLIDLLKGSVWVNSEPGKGSEFCFSIPFDKGTISQNFSDKGKKTIVKNSKKKNILIVEDDTFNVMLLSELLDEAGFQYKIARTGKETLEMVANKQFDVILMDIRLPDLNGDELTRIIKKGSPHIRVIAQTAYAYVNDIQKIMDAGCDDYISKPIRKDVLISKIKKWLNN